VWVVSLIGVISLVWSIASFIGSQDPGDVEKRVGGWMERGERLVRTAAARLKELTHAWWPSDRHACVQAAQNEFEQSVESIIVTAVPNPKYGSMTNNYLQAQNPKAFAICINWDLARPETQATKAWGFALGGPRPERLAVDSNAISNCSKGQLERSENCTCKVVSRDGVTKVNFPKEWSGGRCQ
jgi:hypothetical protein